MGCKGLGRRIGIGIEAARARGRAARRRLRPWLSEVLEDRQLLATTGVDYVLSGYKWSNPSRITYSIAPDGVTWISGKNTIDAAFDAKFGAGRWEREIARALATWQAAANINIVPVADARYDVNALGASQGDSRFGDIRIGGVAMGEQKILAQSYYPPPQGTTAGGDVEINLSMNYGIGKDFDLFSVLLHETGHSLGLGHPTSTSEVMRAVYGGVVDGLDDGDLVGIRAIYGARQVDVYEAQGFGKTSSKPIDMSAALTTTNTFTSQAASLDVIGETQWFSFVAPSYAGGSWAVTASASNVSMLSPKVTVFDDAGNVLGSAADPSKWSVDATAQMSSLVPGRRYYAAVTGATSDVFGVGAYNLTVSMSGSPAVVKPTTPPPSTAPTAPAPSAPNTPPATGPVYPPSGPVYPTTVVVSPDRFELNNSSKTATRLGRLTQASYAGLTLPAADVDFFAFQAGVAGIYQVSASGAVVQVLNARGKVVAQGNGSAAVSATRNASFTVRVQAPGAESVSSYTLNIAAIPAAQRRSIAGRFALARQGMARQEAPAFASAAWASALRNASA